MAIDPVCGMTVDEKSAAAASVHAGTAYYFCSENCLRRFAVNPTAYVHAGNSAREMAPHAGHSHALPAAATTAKKDMAKDPICGMVVDKATALKTERAGRAYYFCSIGCQRTFESPEQELKTMKTRVMVALTGVLVLAILRAGAFLTLATGATIVSWAPVSALPWFTWGMWLFLLVTPVQFIGGWSFYKGAWSAIRTRSINMDFLIALGTSVAYHDTIGGACSCESNTLRYGHHTKSQHACVENFLQANARNGRGKRDMVSNINWFMNVPVEPTGELAIVDGISGPGDYVEMRAEMDVLLVISNCPQINNPCNGFNPTPVRMIIAA